MEFTGPSARIGISLPADMLECLLQRKRQDGIPVSVQIQRAVENDIIKRAEADPPEMSPAEFEAKWRQFLAPLPRTLVDPGVDYETGGE